MTRTGKSPRLHAHLPEPFLSIHPDDAGVMADGDLAQITTSLGSAILRARIDPAQRPGSVFAPMHWTSRFCPAGRINGAVNAHVDPISGQPELKHTPVCIAPYAARWHGFVLTRTSLGADLAPWCSVFPTTQAWQHELAGQEAPEAAFARLRDLCGSAGAWIELHDPACSLFRAALVDDGRLLACVILGANAALPERTWLASLFTQERITLTDRRALLTGRPATGAMPEPPVCVCFGVGAGAIRRAIAAGCHDVEAIGAATRAGTNCGSCRPEIRSLLALVPA
jgi:assimilatory nitrate reductase catalytic subunit